MSLHQYSFNPPLSRLSLVFDQPRRIIFGPNTVVQTGTEASRLGGKKALLLTDENVEKAGLSGRVQEAIEKSAIRVDTYDKISFEPTMDSVQKAVQTARDA